MPEGVLEGVKVLDLSEDLAGSFCARLLADYGADVLKLEPPRGAVLRRMRPFFHDDPHPEKSLFFLVMNLNKKGATLNLETTTGQSILKQLARRVDVIVESFQPGYLASLGLSYDALERQNPSLILTSITPFGQDGPYNQYLGEEIVSYAMGMIMSISGVQGREPLKHGGFQAQYEGGLNAAASTAMALFLQGSTGQGQHIDVSMTECVASTMIGTQTMYPFIGGTYPRRRATGSMFGHPMPCADGWVIAQTGGGATWEGIAEFFPSPGNGGTPVCRKRSAGPVRRGAGPDRGKRHQGPGQVGSLRQCRPGPDTFRPGPDPLGAGQLPPTTVTPLLPGGRTSGDRQNQGPSGAVRLQPHPLPAMRPGTHFGPA